MDWERIGDRAVELLSEYVRIDTSNPPGNEAAGAAFLGRVLAEEGMDYKLFESEPGRTSLVARVPGGGDGKPLVLMNHIDVVPADPGEWQVHPFSGEVSDGFVWGRGTLDMKGMAVMELLAIIAAAREGTRPGRDVVFLACADEEAGGALGCEWLLREHPDVLEAAMVLNEGGFVNTALLGGRPLFLIATAEKYAMWLRLRVKGQGGHGSMPTANGALEKLVLALARLLSHPRPTEVDKTVKDFFGVLAEHWPVLEPFKGDDDPETLVRLLEENHLTAIPALNAMLRNTISLNVLNAGVKVNVIPGEAEASLDCRLLPDQDPGEFLEEVRGALGDADVEVELVLGGDRSPASPAEGEGYETLLACIADLYPDAVAAPFLLPGVSDSRFFRRAGVPVYGIIPAFLGLEDLPRVHGVDERISVEELERGVRFLHSVITSF